MARVAGFIGFLLWNTIWVVLGMRNRIDKLLNDIQINSTHEKRRIDDSVKTIKNT